VLSECPRVCTHSLTCTPLALQASKELHHVIVARRDFKRLRQKDKCRSSEFYLSDAAVDAMSAMLCTTEVHCFAATVTTQLFKFCDIEFQRSS